MKEINIAGTDDRVTKYIIPERVLFKKGGVSGEEFLFIKKPLQISVNEPGCMVMKNTSSGENAVLLIDFGTEFSGGVRILTEKCLGNPAPQMRLTFGESVNEALSDIGEKNATNDHAARDMVVSLCQYSDMKFAETGYRFLKLELMGQDNAVRILSVLGAFTYRDLPYIGSFECDDETLNQIYNVCAYTCHLNMQGMLWDGVKRDRMVWVGDMHPEMLTVKTVFGADLCIEQGLAYSAQKFPLPRYPNDYPTYAMWWLIVCRDWFFYTGDKRFLHRFAGYIKKLTANLCGLILENGEDTLAEIPEGYFLDWPTCGTPDAKGGVRALFSLALEAGAALCEWLNESALIAGCREKAAALAVSVPQSGAKSAIAIMSLAGHMGADRAADLLLKDEAKGFSTFMSYYILTALANAGKTAGALDLLREYYGGMLDTGATTFWEDFSVDWLRPGASIEKYAPGEYDIHGDNGAYCYTGFRHSLCHGWSSAPAAFLAEQVLGIQIAAPGCKAVRIRPQLGALTWAKGTYPTPHGTISVLHTKKSDGRIETQTDLPAAITKLD